MNEFPEVEQVDISDQFTGLIKFALDHGIQLIRDQGALMPFTISVTQGEFNISTFPMPPVEALESAKKYVASLPSDTEAYVIVFIGDITLSGKPYQAVVVEGAERGETHGFRVGQPFEAIGSPPRLQLVGEAINFGFCEQLMA
jgi:hypothetical protein